LWIGNREDGWEIGRGRYLCIVAIAPIKETGFEFEVVWQTVRIIFNHMVEILRGVPSKVILFELCHNEGFSSSKEMVKEGMMANY
jgi:hypothetical protein